MDNSRSNLVRAVGAGLLVVVLALFVWRVREVIVTVLVTLVAAYVLRPAVELFERITLRTRRGDHHLPRWLATLLTFLLLGLVCWGLWTSAVISLGREIADLQSHWQDYQAVLSRWAADLDRSYREQLPASLRPSVDSWLAQASQLCTQILTRGLGRAFHGLGFLVELLLVPILAFYLLADGPNIRRQTLFFIPRRYLPRTELALDQAHDIFQRYIKGQVILCLIAFVLVTLGLWAIQVDFYLLLGLVAGLTRAVPIIGPVVGAIPILLVVLLTTRSTALTLWVLLLFSIMHLLESKLLMPAVLGRQLDLHPVLIIVALLVGAQMGGLLGVFLAAPVLAVIKVLIAERRRGGGPLAVA